MLCSWLIEERGIIKKLFFSTILCLLDVLGISSLDVHAYLIKENDVSYYIDDGYGNTRFAD